MRCSATECKRKLPTLTAYECKCKKYFCRHHRLAPDHDCSFDWKDEWKNKLEKSMPRIVVDKIQRRNYIL